MDDPRIVISLFMHGLTPHLQNEVLKCNPSEVDEAYRLVEHMEHPSDDLLIMAQHPAKTTTTRPTSVVSSSQASTSRGNGQTVPTTSVGLAPQPRITTPSDTVVQTLPTPQAHITCFKCQGKGHRASQCPSSNLLIGIEDADPGDQCEDISPDNDIYVVADELADECDETQGLLGYIQITPQPQCQCLVPPQHSWSV